jgi:hypothetical protein
LELTHLDLSNDLLKNAKLAQELMSKGVERDANRLFRIVCHNYYYSAYHLCLHLIPDLAAKADKMTGGVHTMTRKRVSALTPEGEAALNGLYALRVWADYKLQLSPLGVPIDADAPEIDYRKFIDLLNSALSGRARKR